LSFSFRAVFLAAHVVCLLPSSLAAEGQGSPLARWMGVFTSATPEERRRFATELTIEDVCQACREARAAGSASPEAAAARLLQARWAEATPAAEELTAVLGDAAVAPACIDLAVRVAQWSREALSSAEQDTVAGALLGQSSVAETAERRRELELTAAQFGRNDRVLARMRGYVDATEDATRLQGIRMVGESQDPRAHELSLRQLHEIAAHPEASRASRALTIEIAARQHGGRALADLETLMGSATDWEVRKAAILATGTVLEPRAAAALHRLAREDPALRADSTSSATRALEAALHEATRRMEVGLIGWLEKGEPENARIAFALVDRASAIGPLIDPSAVRIALKELGRRGLVPLADVKRVSDRLASPPGSPSARSTEPDAAP